MTQRARLPYVPRLSIAYLMSWTAVTSAFLAVTAAWRNPYSLWAVDWTYAIASSFSSTIAGWILLGTLLIAWHAIRRTLWRLEPGEWLLLGLLGVVIASWAEAIFSTMMFPRRLADPYQYETFKSLQWWLGIRHMALGALIVVPYVAAVFMVRRERLWAAAIATAAPAMALLVINVLLLRAWWATIAWLGSGTLLAYISLGLMIASIVRDSKNRVARHWLHWSGVTLTMLALASVALSITIRVFSLWW